MSMLQVVFFSLSLRSNLRVDFWGRVYGTSLQLTLLDSVIV